jgi:hypothetical protein
LPAKGVGKQRNENADYQPAATDYQPVGLLADDQQVVVGDAQRFRNRIRQAGECPHDWLEVRERENQQIDTENRPRDQPHHHEQVRLRGVDLVGLGRVGGFEASTSTLVVRDESTEQDPAESVEHALDARAELAANPQADEDNCRENRQ